MKKNILIGLATAALIPLAANAGEVVVQDIWPAGPNSSEMNLYADQPDAAPGIVEYLYGDDFTRLDDATFASGLSGLNDTIAVTAVYAAAQQNLYTAGLTGSPISSPIISPAGTIGGTPALNLDTTTFVPVTTPFLFLDEANGNNTYSDPALNTNPSLVNGVGMVVFEVTGYLDIAGDPSGGYTLFNKPTYVLAFEDGVDNDYNDLVIEVSLPPGPSPSVPDGGATVILLGAALSAMGILRKKLVA